MAYGTFGNVANTQPLPIVRTYYLDAAVLVTTLSPGDTATGIVCGGLTMPFNGDLIYQGSLRMYTSAAGVQAIDAVKVHTTSNPAPTWAASANWRTEGGAGNAVWHMPLVAQWENVAAGTAVVIRAYCQNGLGAPSLTIERASGLAIATFV